MNGERALNVYVEGRKSWCFRCGLKGHVIAACKSKKEESTSKTQPKQMKGPALPKSFAPSQTLDSTSSKIPAPIPAKSPAHDSTSSKNPKPSQAPTLRRDKSPAFTPSPPKTPSFEKKSEHCVAPTLGSSPIEISQSLHSSVSSPKCQPLLNLHQIVR